MNTQAIQETRVCTPHGEFTIRPSESRDVDGLLALWKAAFGREADRDEWAWKYGGPFGHHTVVCAHESGRIAAAYPGVPLPTRYRERRIRLDVLMDSMSDPEFRGVLGGRRGLFVRTAEHYFALHGGVDKAWALYGFPGQRHFALGKHLLNYVALPSPAAYLSRAASPAGWCWRPLRVAEWDRSMGLGVFTALDACLGTHYPVAVVRDETFIRWRFLDHPHKHYRIWLARSLGGRVLGYAVTLRRGNVVRLVDVLLPPEESMVRAFMIRLAREMRAEADQMDVWLPREHFLLPMLQAAGFVEGQEPIGFIPGRRDLAPEADGLFGESFFYTLGDTDVD